jgi:hypothetical protein
MAAGRRGRSSMSITPDEALFFNACGFPPIVSLILSAPQVGYSGFMTSRAKAGPKIRLKFYLLIS